MAQSTKALINTARNMGKGGSSDPMGAFILESSMKMTCTIMALMSEQMGGSMLESGSTTKWKAKGCSLARWTGLYWRLLQ